MFSYIKKWNWKGIHGIWKRTLTELKNSYKFMRIFIDLFSVIFPGFFFPIPRINTGIQSHKFIIWRATYLFTLLHMNIWTHLHWFQASGNSALYSNLVQVAALDLDIYFILLLYTTIINLKLTYLMSNSKREIGFNNYLFYKKMNINLSPLKFSFISNFLHNACSHI